MSTVNFHKCIICLEEKIINYHRITSRCTHVADACLDCINDYIDTRIKSNEIKITCPNLECDKLMARNDIKSLAKREIYERFNNFFIKKGGNKTLFNSLVNF